MVIGKAVVESECTVTRPELTIASITITVKTVQIYVPVTYMHPCL